MDLQSLNGSWINRNQFSLLRKKLVLNKHIVLLNIFLLVTFHSLWSHKGPFPIQFCIPEIKMVTTIPHKDKDFAFLIPGDLSTYIYTSESVYYHDYQRSYFAITKKKGGWDCMRHYEILANGCIPYFIDLDKCNENTMAYLPKDLILEAMNLEGVSYLKIDHTKFNRAKYYELLNKILEYTRTHLTTKKMAEYLLETINYSGSGKILFLSNDVSPDYMRCCMLAGLKELLGDRIIDFPKIDHIYTSYLDAHHLYGKGFSYTQIVDDIPVDRENIEQRIRNKEFDIVIYGSVHRGLRFHNLVRQTYDVEKIVYICGEDDHQCIYSHFPNLFLREFDAYTS